MRYYVLLRYYPSLTFFFYFDKWIINVTLDCVVKPGVGKREMHYGTCNLFHTLIKMRARGFFFK